MEIGPKKHAASGSGGCQRRRHSRPPSERASQLPCLLERRVTRSKGARSRPSIGGNAAEDSRSVRSRSWALVSENTADTWQADAAPQSLPACVARGEGRRPGQLAMTDRDLLEEQWSLGHAGTRITLHTAFRRPAPADTSLAVRPSSKASSSARALKLIPTGSGLSRQSKRVQSSKPQRASDRGRGRLGRLTPTTTPHENRRRRCVPTVYRRCGSRSDS